MPAAHLEGACRRVVLVLEPHARAQPLGQQGPGVLGRRLHAAVDDRAGAVERVGVGQQVHVAGSSRASAIGGAGYRMILRLARARGLELHEDFASFFTSKPVIVSVAKKGFFRFRRKFFGWMLQNSPSVASTSALPPNRVIELGARRTQSRVRLHASGVPTGGRPFAGPVRESLPFAERAFRPCAGFVGWRYTAPHHGRCEILPAFAAEDPSAWHGPLAQALRRWVLRATVVVALAAVVAIGLWFWPTVR